MLRINFKENKLSNDIEIDILVKKTEGYIDHDTQRVYREASLMKMRRKLMSGKRQLNILEE